MEKSRLRKCRPIYLLLDARPYLYFCLLQLHGLPGFDRFEDGADNSGIAIPSSPEPHSSSTPIGSRKLAFHLIAARDSLLHHAQWQVISFGGTMEKNTLKQLYIEELRDIYDAENQLIKALPKMAKAAASEELRTGFEEHLEQTKGHAQRLEKIFSALSEKPTGKKCKE